MSPEEKNLNKMIAQITKKNKNNEKYSDVLPVAVLSLKKLISSFVDKCKYQ